jgi:hypothetical protein
LDVTRIRQHFATYFLPHGGRLAVRLISEKSSEQKEYDRRNTENSDDDSLDVPRRLVDEGEDVHHIKKERTQHSGGAAAG